MQYLSIFGSNNNSWRNNAGKSSSLGIKHVHWRISENLNTDQIVRRSVTKVNKLFLKKAIKSLFIYVSIVRVFQAKLSWKMWPLEENRH